MARLVGDERDGVAGRRGRRAGRRRGRGVGEGPWRDPRPRRPRRPSSHRLPRLRRRGHGRRRGGLAGGPVSDEGPPRRQGTGSRTGDAGPVAGRGAHRHRAGRLPRLARAARLHASRRGPARPGHHGRDRSADRPAAVRHRRGRVGHAGRRGDGDPRPRLGARCAAGRPGRPRAPRHGRGAAGAAAGAHGACRDRRGPAGTSRAVRRVRRGHAPGRGGGARPCRAAVQPRLAQAAPGDPVRRSQPAEDEEDQDRLHHRRRVTAAAVRPDAGPAARAAPGVARPLQAPADRRRADPAGRRRQPDPHHLQPAGRLDRAAVERRPEPAEHPHPHRGGPAHPRLLRRRVPASRPC